MHALENHMRQCMDADNLHRRLKKIQGQISAIDRMIDEDVPCEDIIIQINAVKSAVHKVGQIVMEGHIHHCVRDGIEHGDAERTIEEFTKVIDQFSKIRPGPPRHTPWGYQILDTPWGYQVSGCRWSSRRSNGTSWRSRR